MKHIHNWLCGFLCVCLGLFFGEIDRKMCERKADKENAF